VSTPITVKIKRLHDGAIVPRYATAGAACFDLHALEAGEVGAYSTFKVRTGVAVEIPPCHVMLIYSRSGHGFRNGVRLVNAVGVIDADYRGEIAVGLKNDTPLRFEFEAGARIAQAMILPIPAVALLEVDELAATARGEGGFGSTGT